MGICYYCGREIFFHPKWTSYKTGKVVPLIKKKGGGYSRHRCVRRKTFIRQRWFNNYGPRVILN